MKKCKRCKADYQAKDKRRKFCSLACYRKYQKENPNRGAFGKEHKPWNKGIKGIHLSPTSEFKKGQQSVNIKSVGTITIRKEKSGTRRQWIKIAEPKEWIEYAKYIWLKSGRELIKGLCLHHINLNSLDDRIENLCLVTRQDHPKLHNRWNTKNKLLKHAFHRKQCYN